MYLATVVFIASSIASSTTASLGLAFSIARSDSRRCRAHRWGGTAIKSVSGNIVECPNDESHAFEFKADSSGIIGNHRFGAQVFASSKCWGRRPFIMRNAFDPNLLLGAVDENRDRGGEETIFEWPSWGDVVEIAADDESESRIISHVSGDNTSFDLEWGPLSEKDFNSWLFKESDSNEEKRREALVVNDIDRFYPPLADWMHDVFHFIPNWRMDDAQISLAERGGGIGPHVDNYDVFLIQMSGTRTWQVGKKTINAKEERDRMVEGLDVRVLNDWNSDGGNEREEWKVNPGDLLYLPPRIAHCGTALTSGCMTLSVGCRAPSVSDLVSKLAEKLSSSIEDSAVRRFTDEDLLKRVGVEDAPGELTNDAKEHAKHLVLDSLTSIISDDEWWDEFFGRYVTEQKRVRSNYPIPCEGCADDDPPDEWGDAQSTVQKVLGGRGVLYQAEGIAFAYSSVPSKRHHGRSSHRFYVNGDMWHGKSDPQCAKQDEMAQIFRLVSNHRRLDRSMLLAENDSGNHASTQQPLTREVVQFLEELVTAGVLYGSEE